MRTLYLVVLNVFTFLCTFLQLYEDAVELQLFFIRLRDEICKNGELFITPALSYTEQMFNIAVDQVRLFNRQQRQLCLISNGGNGVVNLLLIE